MMVKLGNSLDGRMQKTPGFQWAFDKYYDILVHMMEECRLNDTPVMLITELLILYQLGEVSLVDLKH